jgi:hypothetical protein
LKKFNSRLVVTIPHKGKLKPRDKLFVIRVGADKKPEHYVASISTDGTIVVVNSDRPYIFMRWQFLELQARMARVLREQPVGIANLSSDGGWKLCQVAAEIGTGARSHS